MKHKLMNLREKAKTAFDVAYQVEHQLMDWKELWVPLEDAGQLEQTLEQIRREIKLLILKTDEYANESSDFSKFDTISEKLSELLAVSEQRKEAEQLK